jgi:hypothetical protein
MSGQYIDSFEINHRIEPFKNFGETVKLKFSVPSGNRGSGLNIIVGSNGTSKSRFLRTLDEFFQNNGHDNHRVYNGNQPFVLQIGSFSLSSKPKQDLNSLNLYEKSMQGDKREIFTKPLLHLEEDKGDKTGHVNLIGFSAGTHLVANYFVHYSNPSLRDLQFVRASARRKRSWHYCLAAVFGN